MKLVNVVHKEQQVKLDQEGQMVYKALKVSRVNVDKMESLDLKETSDLLALKV